MISVATPAYIDRVDGDPYIISTSHRPLIARIPGIQCMKCLHVHRVPLPTCIVGLVATRTALPHPV